MTKNINIEDTIDYYKTLLKRNIFTLISYVNLLNIILIYYINSTIEVTNRSYNNLKFIYIYKLASKLIINI